MLATRRNLMAAVAVLPIAACPAPLPAAGVDPEWSRLLAAYTAAEADQVARHAAFADQDEAWDAERTPRPVAPEPPAFDQSMSLAAIVATTSTLEWKARWAAYEADAKEWDRRNAAARTEAVGNAEDAWEAADDVATDAFMAVRSYPVTTLAALAQKADAMTARYGGDLEASEALALIADIRRLAGREA